MNEHFDRYNQGISECDTKLDLYQRNIDSKQQAIALRNAEFLAYGFAKKVMFWLVKAYKNWKDQSIIDSLEKEIRRLPSKREKLLRELVLNLGRWLMQQSQDTATELTRFETEHQDIKSIVNSISSVRSAGRDALSKLESAKSSVSSAQTMEVMDLVTKNKGISTMSTVSNMSASGDIDSAKSAVERFNSRLREHQRVIANLEGTTAIEYMDLTFDLFFGGAMDFVGSVMSLFSLSTAENQIDDAITKVKNSLNEIEPAYRDASERLKEHEREMLNFKNQERLKVLPLLRERGIEITEDLVGSMTELYARAS